MLGLALAVSNAPYMYRPKKDWQAIYDSQLTDGVESPNELADETEEVVDDYILRIQEGFSTLRAQLDQYKPDVVVVLGSDDGISFSDAQVPQFCTYTGDEVMGSTAIAALGEDPTAHTVELPCLPNFAWELQTSLVHHGFDINYMSIQNPLGRPEYGMASAFTRPTSVLLEGSSVPVVPVFVNCRVEPTPSGHRVHDFGTAIGDILEDAPLKAALLTVGGLSHDPNGARSGWIDTRLDSFVLTHLGKGDSSRLKTLFDVDSDTLSGGTGEVRTWIAAGAAAETKGGKATIVDYIPAHRAMTGIGFAHWTLD